MILNHNLLSEWMTKNCYSVRAFAKATNTAPSTVQRLKIGSDKPIRPSTVRKLAEFMGFAPEKLII